MAAVDQFTPLTALPVGDDAGAAAEACDVLVVGGGGSGLAAAIEARRLGRRVILLEREPRLGGSTARSVGSITASNTPHQLRIGVQDCPDDHFADMSGLNDQLGLDDNLKLRRLLVDNVSDTVRWLMSLGVEFFGPLPEGHHRKPRMLNVLPNSRAYIYHLSREARRVGVDIRLSARVTRLIFDGARVCGVMCDFADGSRAVTARGGVVLTSGDYSGNAQMKAAYLAPEFAIVDPVNPANCGDGHLMAMDLGGRIVNAHLKQAGVRFQAPPPSWVTALPPWRIMTRFMNWAMRSLPGWLLRPFIMSFLTTILRPEPSLFASGAVLINKRGERFDDERRYGDGPYPKPDPLLALQPDKLGYLLLDRRIVEKFSRWPHFVSTAPGVAYAYMPDYRRTRKDVFHAAPTLAGIARKIGADAAVLEKTVADYNATLAADRPPLGQGPYVAMGPVKFLMNFTDGGLAVNERLEVLGAGDKPIPGLFAAGFTGMGGVLLQGHGHHLGWAFTSGRFAGRHAAYRATTPDIAAPARH